MDNEKMMVVLTELLEGQKEIFIGQEKILAEINQVNICMQKIELLASNGGVAGQKMDLKSMQHSIEEKIEKIKLIVENTIPTTQQSNLRIFLESDAKKWAVYLVVAVTFLTYLYWFVIHK